MKFLNSLLGIGIMVTALSDWYFDNILNNFSRCDVTIMSANMHGEW